MEFHPIANCFPLMEGKEFDDLVADIKARGVRTPILLYQGKILDGRNRYRAAASVGSEKRVLANARTYEGDDPYAEVVSANIHRRHLTVSQLGCCAAEMATLKSGEMGLSLPRTSSGKFMPSVSRDTLGKPPSVHSTQKEVARLFGISRPTVARAAYVKKKAPELIPEIRSGKLTVNTAATIVRNKAKQAQGIRPSNVQQQSAPEPRVNSDVDGRFNPYTDLFYWLLDDQGVDEKTLVAKIGGCQIERFINALDEVLKRRRQDDGPRIHAAV